MSIVQTQTTSFKAELYEGIHDLVTDVIKIALYTGAANLNETTTEYTTANEVTGGGYSPGGEVMLNIEVFSSGSTAYVKFDDVSFGAVTAARCALIYNFTEGGKSVAVLDFGSDKTSTNLTITMPVATPTTALLRSSN
jgi:hypothetical protein